MSKFKFSKKYPKEAPIVKVINGEHKGLIAELCVENYTTRATLSIVKLCQFCYDLNKTVHFINPAVLPNEVFPLTETAAQLLETLN